MRQYIILYAADKRVVDAKRLPTGKAVIAIATQEDHRLPDFKTRQIIIFLRVFRFNFPVVKIPGRHYSLQNITFLFK